MLLICSCQSVTYLDVHNTANKKYVRQWSISRAVVEVRNVLYIYLLTGVLTPTQVPGPSAEISQGFFLTGAVDSLGGAS